MIKLIATLISVLSCATVSDALAADRSVKDIRELKLFRFEFDNDAFLGSDDAFSAGWSLQVHSPMLDEWPPGLTGWIGRFPTLGDDGEGGDRALVLGNYSAHHYAHRRDDRRRSTR
jgi:hypothetical protein